MDWTPTSWRGKPALQQPQYPDAERAAAVEAQLADLPPLVTSWEILNLRQQLAEAAAGKRFVLQGGDCAERFDDCRPAKITSKLKILLQMSLVLVQGSRKPVIRVGRFAGQYAKPRSADFETRGGVSLPSYRGELINRSGFTAAERAPDPELMLRGYERAALTLNFIRALIKGGFADLHHPEYWDLDFAKDSPQAHEYHALVGSIGEALRFMENILGVRPGDTDRIDFFTSHEALLLPYEAAQTRRVPRRPGYYNLASHFPWIGLRTAEPDGAHVECLRGIENPVGVKIGPGLKRNDLLRLLDKLLPADTPGKLALIHRYGAERIADELPAAIETVKRSGRRVLWICDPMHGNTRTTAAGVKTRRFDDIMRELELALGIHGSAFGFLGGIHIELTGDNVTECTGGASGLTDADLGEAYESEVDPRLNCGQALELALLIARKMQAGA